MSKPSLPEAVAALDAIWDAVPNTDEGVAEFLKGDAVIPVPGDHAEERSSSIMDVVNAVTGPGSVPASYWHSRTDAKDAFKPPKPVETAEHRREAWDAEFETFDVVKTSEGKTAKFERYCALKDSGAPEAEVKEAFWAWALNN